MSNLVNLSSNKALLASEILNLIIEEFQIQKPNYAEGNKISLTKFSTKGYSIQDIQFSLEIANLNGSIIELLNTRLKSNPPFTFDPIATRAYGEHKQQIDYQNYINELNNNVFILLKDKSSISKLKQVILKLNKKQSNSPKVLPAYNNSLHHILMKNKVIKIPPNSNQDELCKIVLKDKKSIYKNWSYDEIMEIWGEEYDKSMARKIYSAAREINEKIAIETGIKNFFITTLKTLQINPTLI